MNDRELLEKAAKAVGIELREWHPDANLGDGAYLGSDGYLWNPITDDGDALRLAVKLRIGFAIDFDRVDVAASETVGATEFLYELPTPTDPYAATRRAIVRAAAEIGKEMK